MLLNTTAIEIVTKEVTLSSIQLSAAPLTGLSYGDAAMLAALSSLTGTNNTVTFNIDISSVATSSYDALLPSIQQNTIIVPTSGLQTIIVGDIFDEDLLSEDGFDITTMDQISGLSGTAQFQVFTTIVTETSAISTVRTPVTHLFTLSRIMM